METSIKTCRKVGLNPYDFDDLDGSVPVLGFIGIDQTQAFEGSYEKQ